MPAQFSPSYSLWPEQARPRHRGSVALVSGGFVAGLVVAMAGNWMLPDSSRPTVRSEDVGTAAAIATSTLSRDEDSGAPQGEAAPIPPTRGRSRAAATARLPIIGSKPAIVERDGTDGRGDGAPPSMVAEELTRVAPVRSGPGGVDMSALAAPPETFSRLDGALAPKQETPQTTATLEGAGNEAGRPTVPVSTVGETGARETASGEGPSENAKPTITGSKKVMRKQSRTAAERFRRAERRTARRIPASDRIRKMPSSPFDYVAEQSYGYLQPRYSYAAQQSYQRPRYGYAAQQSYHYTRPRYDYVASPQSSGLFPF